MQESNKLFLDPNRISAAAMVKLQRGYRVVHGTIMTYEDLAMTNLGEAKAYLAAADRADMNELLARQDASKPASRKRRSLQLRAFRRPKVRRYVLASAATTLSR